MNELIYFIIAVFSTSFLSGIAGVGGGVLLFTLMMPIFPISIIIPLHGTIQLFSNTSRVLLSLQNINKKIFAYFTLGAIVGAICTLPLNIKVDSYIFTYIIVSTILIFTWFPTRIFKIHFKGKFFVIGYIATFLSIFIGSTGPLTAPFFLNSELDKNTFVPTKSACQIPVHLFKVIIYIFSGFVLSKYLIYIIIAIPVVSVGAFLGKIITEKINTKYYYLFIKIIITVLAIRTILKNII